jgi:hypothetical protein|nr:MAG TPA: hypothetical protein [Caudoviricetes sp.]
MTEQHEKIANELEKALNQFSENVNKILEEMFSFKGKTEKDWEMKCPYKKGDEYWYINQLGEIFQRIWYKSELLDSCLYQGNTFPTEQAAVLEAKRRNLLTRFRAFRDECNNGWKADCTDVTQKKYYISYSEIKNGLYVSYIVLGNHLHTFSYFKNEQDAERAIELFGEEIKELFVECD